MHGWLPRLLGLALFAAACAGSDSDPLGPRALDPAGGPARVDVCHYDDDTAGWKLLTLPMPAANAHRAHHPQDGEPGGAVPEQAATFGGACEVVPDAPPPPPDTDEDGVPDADDNCPGHFNPDQNDADMDGLGDVCDPFDNRDADDDGVPDAIDNCPDAFNPDQTDTDFDGIGDACDPVDDRDADGDGVIDPNDNCPDHPNPGQQDTDGDGLGDACDSPSPDGFEPNNSQGGAAFLGTHPAPYQNEIFANFHDPAVDRDDWFALVLLEEQGAICNPFFPAQPHRLTVRLIPPPGSDYDLAIYVEGSLAGTSTNGGSVMDEVVVNLSGSCFSADEWDVRVHVRHFSGPASYTPYSLTFNWQAQ